jgi:hypothetical protein
MDVIEQQTCVRQQIGVDPQQVTGLPQPLSPAVQERLDLSMGLHHILKHVPWGLPGVQAGELQHGLPDAVDRLVSGIAAGDPGRQPVTVRSQRQAIRLFAAARAEQDIAGNSEGSAVQLHIRVTGPVGTTLIADNAPDYVLNTRQPCLDPFISRTINPQRHLPLTPPALAPLLTQPSSPGRRICGHRSVLLDSTPDLTSPIITVVSFNVLRSARLVTIPRLAVPGELAM